VARSISGSLRAILRSVRILRIGKLIRLFKAPEITKFVAERIRSDMVILVASILSNLVVLLCLAHFIACAWYWIGHGLPSDQHDVTWVTKYIPSAESATVSEKYTWALHWSLAQFTGELIFMPENSTERGFAVFVLLLSFCASVVFAAGITTSMTRLMMVAGRHTSQLSTLRRYLFDHNISISLSVRMQRNGQHHLLEQKRNVPEDNVELLKVISEPLKVELHYELYSPALKFHPFFENFNDMNTAGLGMICHNGVTTTHLAMGDVVFNDCETAVEAEARMYFLVRGRLSYKQQRTDIVFMESGDWACEAILWTHWMHCGTLCAGHDENCILLGVHGQKFRSVLSTSPFPPATVYARSFVKELNRGANRSTGALQLPTDLQTTSIVEQCVSEAFPQSMGCEQSSETTFEGFMRLPARAIASGIAFRPRFPDNAREPSKASTVIPKRVSALMVHVKPAKRQNRTAPGVSAGEEDMQPNASEAFSDASSYDGCTQTTEVQSFGVSE